MVKKTYLNQLNYSHLSHSYIWVLVVLMILVDIWYGFQRYDVYQKNQLQSMHDEVELIASDLESQLLTLNTQSQIFATVFASQIAAYKNKPSDTQLQRALQDKVERMLSGALTYKVIEFEHQSTLTDSIGHSGDIDMHHFTSRRMHVDKGKLSYHFDIVVDWAFEDQKGLFVVSYHTGDISYTLSKKINKHVRIYL